MNTLTRNTAIPLLQNRYVNINVSHKTKVDEFFATVYGWKSAMCVTTKIYQPPRISIGVPANIFRRAINNFPDCPENAYVRLSEVYRSTKLRKSLLLVF